MPVGYADGYPRLASGRSQVLVRGERRSVAATISMDQLTCIVDERVQLGDEVVLIGEQGDERITAEELAAHTETIAWETVCATSLAARRGRRTYTGQSWKPPRAVPFGTALGRSIPCEACSRPQSDHSRSILDARMPPTFS